MKPIVFIRVGPYRANLSPGLNSMKMYSVSAVLSAVAEYPETCGTGMPFEAEKGNCRRLARQSSPSG